MNGPNKLEGLFLADFSNIMDKARSLNFCGPPEVASLGQALALLSNKITGWKGCMGHSSLLAHSKVTKKVKSCVYSS